MIILLCSLLDLLHCDFVSVRFTRISHLRNVSDPQTLQAVIEAALAGAVLLIRRAMYADCQPTVSNLRLYLQRSLHDLRARCPQMLFVGGIQMAAAKWQQANGVKKCENGRPKKVRNRQPKKCENERRSAKTVENLVALYRAIRLQFGYGFESCDANGLRNAKNTNLAKPRPGFSPHFCL